MEANDRRTNNSLDSYGWGKEEKTVESWLFAEGYQFDFFQAVRLLEMIQAADGPETTPPDPPAQNGTRNTKQRAQVSPGEGADPSREIVRFKSAVNLGFPASDIATINSGSAADIGIVINRSTEGARIMEVFPGSPAARAGLLKDDVILTVNSTPVHDFKIAAVTAMIRGLQGTVVHLVVLSEGKRRSVDVVRTVTHANGNTVPAAMVDHFKKREMPAEMTVNFLGLAGGLGALDIPTTELVMQRSSRNDQGLKDFLDIFNHRLVSLLYQIRKHHRVGLGVTAPGEDRIARYLYSMIGMGTPNLLGRMQVRDRALLYYSGILAHQSRSMAGLERLLGDYFKVEAKGNQFEGNWCELEESQWTVIGASGRNQRLGRDAVVVGTRVWDQHARFEIRLGPLSLEQFVGFLPTNWRFGVLCDLIRFYVKDDFDFNVRLILRGSDITRTRLKAASSKANAPNRPNSIGLLAWTSRLASPQLRGSARGRHERLPAKVGGGLSSLHRDMDEDFQITISPESLRSTDFSIKSRFLSRLPHGKQSELMGMTAPGKHDRHTVVMHQGDPGVSMFVISSGKVQISRRGETSGERVVSILGEGDTFGERAVLLKKPYSETALTLTECEITEIKSEQLYAFASQHPSLQRIIDEYKSGDVAQKAQVATLTIKK